uniref:ZT_dimer domain-containing protein n=1 Tax=Caenorhabditis japonica TaxID=281687 RepID=A0A8R1HVY4_CAEJA
MKDSETLPLITRKSPVKYYHNENVSRFERKKREKCKKEYYARFDELNELYTEDEKLMQGINQPSENEQSTDRLLANLSIALNLTLLFTNLLAAYLSGSLSIVSTFVDSLMDVTSGLIIGICLKLIKNTNMFNYPRGRNRLELVGVIICSILMGIANTLLVMESITSIIEGDINPVMDVYTLGIMLGGSAIKIFLCVVCYKRGTSSSKVLAMDMRNDIATSIVAIVCATIGDRYWSYADPIGAILVCGVIATTWYRHALEHVPHLVGRRAESENLSRILKIVIEHDPRIKYVDHVMVYHTTLEALAEVHIVMDENLSLRVTHDIAQGLEAKLMLLDFVERSFVHCDYECDGDK